MILDNYDGRLFEYKVELLDGEPFVVTANELLVDEDRCLMFINEGMPIELGCLGIQWGRIQVSEVVPV